MSELAEIFKGVPVVIDDDGLGSIFIDERPHLAPVYRMPERDATKGPPAALPDDTLISYQRIVARVGYEFGVHSVSRKEWNQAGLEIIAEQTGLPTETVRRVVLALQLHRPFRGIHRLIYDAKVVPLTHRGSNRNIRAMWFYDYDKPRRGRVTGRVVKLTGTRQPGYASSYEPSEYDPPFLSNIHRQTLYRVADYNTGERVMIYPGDLL